MQPSIALCAMRCFSQKGETHNHAGNTCNFLLEADLSWMTAVCPYQDGGHRTRRVESVMVEKVRKCSCLLLFFSCELVDVLSA